MLILVVLLFVIVFSVVLVASLTISFPYTRITKNREFLSDDVWGGTEPTELRDHVLSLLANDLGCNVKQLSPNDRLKDIFSLSPFCDDDEVSYFFERLSNDFAFVFTFDSRWELLSEMLIGLEQQFHIDPKRTFDQFKVQGVSRNDRLEAK